MICFRRSACLAPAETRNIGGWPNHGDAGKSGLRCAEALEGSKMEGLSEGDADLAAAEARDVGEQLQCNAAVEVVIAAALLCHAACGQRAHRARLQQCHKGMLDR